MRAISRRAERREREHLEPVREQIAVAEALAVFAVVVDGMVVAGERLEEREVRFGDRARGERKFLAEDE